MLSPLPSGEIGQPCWFNPHRLVPDRAATNKVWSTVAELPRAPSTLLAGMKSDQGRDPINMQGTEQVGFRSALPSKRLLDRSIPGLNFSMVGLIDRQGPHQGAQKSTTTGLGELRNFSKKSSLTWDISGSKGRSRSAAAPSPASAFIA